MSCILSDFGRLTNVSVVREVEVEGLVQRERRSHAIKRGVNLSHRSRDQMVLQASKDLNNVAHSDLPTSACAHYCINFALTARPVGDWNMLLPAKLISTEYSYDSHSV